MSETARLHRKELRHAFIGGYVGAALELAVNEVRNGDEWDYTPARNARPADLSQDALRAMIRDCHKFLAWDYMQANPYFALSMTALMQPWRRSRAALADVFRAGGRDFWLTRNRHGAGFWDGDWPESYAQHLTDWAHRYPEALLSRPVGSVQYEYLEG